MKALAAIAAALLALGACGPGNVLTEGEVVNSAYHPEETRYVPGPCSAWATRVSRIGNRTTTRQECVAYQYVPHTTPERWRVRIEGTHEGEARSEWHDVSEGCFDRVELGWWITVPACDRRLR